jgi:hypothetical protein
MKPKRNRNTMSRNCALALFLAILFSPVAFFVYSALA